MLHTFEATLRENNQLNPLTKLWCKISTFVVLNFNLLEYIKLVKLLLSKLLGQLKTNEHLTLLPSWKTNCTIVWAQILTCALGSIVNRHLHYKIFYMTRPLPNCWTRCIIVHMHSSQQNFKSWKVLQRFSRLQICIYRPYKDVKKNL
jgi:hypothetical protein